MTLYDNFSLKSWLRALRYSVEYYDDTCEPTKSNGGTLRNMSIGEKGKEESGDGLYANVWECTGSLPYQKSTKKFKNSLESVENSSAVSNYEENVSIYESARSSCGSPTNTRNFSENTDKVSEITDLDDLQSDNISAQFSEDLNNPSPIYENLQIYQENIYENLPLAKPEQEFEEEIYTTIKYLENVLDAADSSSDEDDYASNLTEDFCEKDILGDGSSVNSELEDYCDVRNVEEEKFTESSSSFGEYLRVDQTKTAQLEKGNPNQRFAKENKTGTFFEEPEPISPQEIKDIPVPKRNNISKPWQRFSFPVKVERENTARPQSFPVFLQHSPKNDTILKYNIENEEYSDEYAKNTGESDIDNETVDDFDVRDRRASRNKGLNLSFAKEYRVSVLFDEKVEELNHLEVAEKSIFGNDLILRLKENAITWMTLLMEDFCEEMEDIMEEKELLKSVNQIQKDRSTPVDNKFPIDDETVQVRRHSSIARNRISKTTDFDAHKRKNDYHSSNAKNFEVRGVIKIQSSYGPNWLIKQKDEHVLYENENLYRVNNSTRKKELIKGGMVIRSARHLSSRGKESTEVELKDNFNYAYTLTFVSSKSAKQFMENDKIQVYASDHKVTIKDTLLRFLGKRSSREILEKKGIYKNEPIFGNTLKEIYIKSQILVPPFIHKILELIERPENIKSMGLYRTSGNLATIQKIRYDVDNGRLDLLENFAKDPDVLTGSLKLFFRELKEPLMPFEVYEKLAETIKIPLKLLSSKDHQKIRSTVVKYLYEANLATFRVIMRHLVEVVKYKEDNKMDAYNLAICWGPSLIFTNPVALTGPNPEFPKDLVSQSQDATRLVDFLIGYYEMYPSELGSRPESFSEKFLSLKRQESKDSIESADSSIKSYKKSNSNLSLSVDEVMKRAVEYIELNLSSDGLYQRSGTPEKTNKIMKKLNKKKSSELDKYRNDVYDMCDALKKYLKDYSEPLVDRNTVELLAMIFSHNQDHLEVNIRREAIATIEKTSRKDSLIYLLRHLAKVLNHQPFHKVTKHETIGLWTKVLNHEYRIHPSNETFAKFLTVAVEVFNDNLPDLVKSSFNNNGNSQNRNENMAEVLKDLRQHQERDRNSRYDNIDCEVIGEASLLDEKTEQTKL